MKSFVILKSPRNLTVHTEVYQNQNSTKLNDSYACFLDLPYIFYIQKEINFKWKKERKIFFQQNMIIFL